MIIDFDSRFPDRDLVEHAYRCPSSTGDTTLPAAGLVLDQATIAHVNHGRWIADCPTEGCGGAEFISIAEPRFFCCECRNAATAHVPIRVVVPDETTCAQVDVYLSARPVPATRNWAPGQPVKELQLENRDNGIKLR